MWSSVIGALGRPAGKTRAHPGPAAGRAQLGPQAGVGRCPRAGSAGPRWPTKSSRIIARGVAVAPGAATLLPRSPQRSNSSSGAPAGLSSPSKAMNTIVGRSLRGLIVRASWVSTAVPDGAVVGAHEAGHVLGVVVGADHHHCAGSRPGTMPTTLRRPPGHRLEAAARAARGGCARRALRDAGEPAGPRPERHLALDRAVRGPRVEAVALGRRHAACGLGVAVAAVLAADEGHVVGGDQGDQRPGQDDLEHPAAVASAIASAAVSPGVRLPPWRRDTRTV